MSLQKVEEDDAKFDEEFDEEVLEVNPWPVNDFTLPTHSTPRRMRRFTSGAILGGILFRILVTYASSFEEVLSIFDLVALLTASFTENIVFILILTLTFSVSGFVTWKFWTPAVEEYVGLGIDRAYGLLRGPREMDVIETNLRRCSNCFHCLTRFFDSKGWLGYVSVASAVALVGMVANEVEEGTREFFEISSLNVGTVVTGLVFAGCELSFSIVSDLHMIWQDRLAAEGQPRTIRRPGTGMYLIVVLGMVALAYRTFIVTYITTQEITQSVGWSRASAIVFTLFGSFQTFCFQAVYAIEGSPLIGKINRGLLGLSLPVKIVFLTANGVTTLVINMVLSTYNIDTLVRSIPKRHFGYDLSPRVSMAIAAPHGAVIAIGDFLTSSGNALYQWR
jgi:hypothetical protein